MFRPFQWKYGKFVELVFSFKAPSDTEWLVMPEDQ